MQVSKQGTKRLIGSYPYNFNEQVIKIMSFNKAREPCVELSVNIPVSKVISLTEIDLRTKENMIRWSETDSKTE